MQEYFIVVKCKNHFLLSCESKLLWPHTEPAGKEQALRAGLHLTWLPESLGDREQARCSCGPALLMGPAGAACCTELDSLLPGHSHFRGHRMLPWPLLLPRATSEPSAPLLCRGLLVDGADCLAHGATFSMAHGHDGA